MTQLHLGCGTEKRKGWVNVDANPKVKPDIVSSADKLPAIATGSVDVIESCHMFEHFTYYQALRALREWNRVLKINGTLFLELPNFKACVEMLGKHTEPQKGFDIGLIGIFGHPPMVESDGLFQSHKWGWTPEALSTQLEIARFGQLAFMPITQTWRIAAKTNRDMRVKAVKIKNV